MRLHLSIKCLKKSNEMYTSEKTTYFSFTWILIIIFAIFYPMLISIYVFLPLLIGLMGHVLMLGIDKNKTSYILIALLYFINLEVNLSLPFLLSIISTLLVYVLFYHYLKYFRMCGVCRPVFSVLFVDAIYIGSLLFYDFIFESSSIVLDSILIYSLVVDILIAVLI